MNNQEFQTPRRILRTLPSWFRLRNYEPVRALDALGWLQQISVRQVCYGQLKDMIIPEWNDAAKQALSSLRMQPVCGSTYPPFNGKELSWCFEIGFLPGREADGPVVRGMRLLDLYRLERQARWACQLSKEQIEEAEKMVRDQRKLRFAHPAWMLTEIPATSPKLAVTIDLAFPNSVLIEHFKLHLQRLRRAPSGRPVDATRQMPELKEWAEQGLLPCMDLILWAEEERGRITDSLLADAVSPVGETDEERMRKTVRPLAGELLWPGVQGGKPLLDLRREGIWKHCYGIAESMVT